MAVLWILLHKLHLCSLYWLELTFSISDLLRSDKYKSGCFWRILYKFIIFRLRLKYTVSLFMDIWKIVLLHANVRTRKATINNWLRSSFVNRVIACPSLVISFKYLFKGIKLRVPLISTKETILIATQPFTT